MKVRQIVITTPLAIAAASSNPKIWHFTDIHVDPIYVVGANIYAYCNGNVTDNVTSQAARFGEPAGDCATPFDLYESAVGYLKETTEAADSSSPYNFVFFTGDNTQAGLPTQADVLITIAHTWDILEAALPDTPLYGAIGNHDSFPGNQFPHPFDYFYNVASIWDNWLTPEAKTTVIDGGYYSVPAHGLEDSLQIICMNSMYLVNLNSHVVDETDPAHAFGYTMMSWFEAEVSHN